MFSECASTVPLRQYGSYSQYPVLVLLSGNLQPDLSAIWPLDYMKSIRVGVLIYFNIRGGSLISKRASLGQLQLLTKYIQLTNLPPPTHTLNYHTF